jgi:hypothetical protein
MEDTIDLRWRKSSFSGNGGNCLEIGQTEDAILVRDTKDRDGAVLTVSADAWAEFTAALK